MASPQTIEIEALLLPIPGPSPAGESVRYAGPYDRIQEARRADDALAQGDWKRDTKTSDWPVVVTAATETLSKRSKDLQIGAWLLEALVKLHGFAGLRDGLRLLRELEERFWDGLYPAPEDGDLEARAAPLEWLNEKLPGALRSVPVTRLVEGIAYSWLHWDESRNVESLGRQNPEAKQEAVAEGKITAERFDKATAVSPRAFYEPLLDDLNQAWEEFERLDQVSDEKFGRQAASLLNVKKSLEDVRSLVEGITKKKRLLEPDPVGSSADRGAEVGQPGPARPRGEGGGPLEPGDRADALRRLAAVAAFFRHTEPHSPVSYLVQRAVQWGEMPLESWLEEVISDESVLARVRETLGLKHSAGRSESSGDSESSS
jgi:type VI secretion system protein ImpA